MLVVCSHIILTLFLSLIGVIVGAYCEHTWLTHNFWQFISIKFHLEDNDLESLKKEFDNIKWK